MRSLILALAILLAHTAAALGDTIHRALKHVDVTASSAVLIEALQAIEEPDSTTPEETVRLTVTLSKEGKVQLPKSRLEISPRTNTITLISKNAASLKAFEVILNGLDQKPVTFYVSTIVAKVELSDKRRHGTDCLQEIKEIMVDGKAQPFSHKAPFLTPELSVDQQEAYLKGLASSMSKLDGIEVLARPSIYLNEAKRGEITTGRTDDKESLSLGIVAKLTEDPDIISLKASFKRSTNNENNILTETELEAPLKSLVITRTETEVEVPNGSLVTLGGAATKDGTSKRFEEIVLISVKRVD